MNCIDAAAFIMARSNRILDATSQNIANLNTGGYKRHVASSALSFDDYIAGRAADRADAIDQSAGSVVVTENPYDLALTGPGFFAVRAGSDILYTRAGQFHRDGDGQLVTADGAILQAEGGGDLRLRHPAVSIAPDGRVIENGEPADRIAIVEFERTDVLISAAGSQFSAAEGAGQAAIRSSVRQGAYESANVATGDEMVAMMAALRRAETGQKLAQLYDDLMGRALTSLGGTQS